MDESLHNPERKLLLIQVLVAMQGMFPGPGNAMQGTNDGGPSAL